MHGMHQGLSTDDHPAEAVTWTLPGVGEASASYRVASKTETAPVQHLGPDYAAVLAVCAAYLWLQPENLHKAVARMESTMLSQEQAAKEAAN